MVATIVERIDRRRVLPTVVTLDRPRPIAHRLAGRGIPVRSLGAYGLRCGLHPAGRHLAKGAVRCCERLRL
jgi:hypothetical protein